MRICAQRNTRQSTTDLGVPDGVTRSPLLPHAGLSASIWTALYVGLFQPNAVDFLLFLAFAPAVLTLVGLCFVNAVPFEQASEALAPRRFIFTIQVGCSVRFRVLRAQGVDAEPRVHITQPPTCSHEARTLINTQGLLAAINCSACGDQGSCERATPASHGTLSSVMRKRDWRLILTRSSQGLRAAGNPAAGAGGARRVPDGHRNHGGVCHPGAGARRPPGHHAWCAPRLRLPVTVSGRYVVTMEFCIEPGPFTPTWSRSRHLRDVMKEPGLQPCDRRASRGARPLSHAPSVMPVLWAAQARCCWWLQ